MWLVTALVLLIPVDLSSFSRVQLQIAQPTRQVRMRQASEGEPAAGGFSNQPGTAQAASAVPDASNAAFQNSGMSARTPLVLPLHSARISLYGFLQLFSCIWLIVAVLLAAFRIFKYRFSLWSLQRWSSLVQNPDVVRLYRSICRRERIAFPPKLMENRNLSTPVLAGLFHPALYLTEAPYDRQELAFILRHELTHYRRKDLWFKLILLAASTVYWFNPFLYLMRSEAEKDIENLCDGRVLQSSPAQSRLHYSQLLLKTAALPNHIPYLSASLNDSKLIFKERIHYLTELANLRRGTPLCLILCILLLAGNLAVGSSVLPIQAQSAVYTDSDSLTTAGNSTSVLEEIDARASANAALTAKNFDGSMLSGTSVTTQPQSGQGNGTGSDADDVPSGYLHDVSAPDQISDSSGHLTGDTSRELSGNSDAGNQGTTPGSSDPGSWNTTPDSSDPGDQSTAPDTSEPGNQEPAPDPSVLPTLTDTRITLYAISENGANYVWQATDGAWYDGDYRRYIQDSDAAFTRADDQSQWTSEAPPSPADHASDTVFLISEDGLNANQLYYNSDTGSWQNIAGGIYTENGDNTFTGPDGTLWFVTP